MSARRARIDSPFKSTVPWDGLDTPARTRMSVVFPAPLSPITATNSPGWMLSETRSRIAFP